MALNTIANAAAPLEAPGGSTHVEFRNISKAFGGVQALSDVSLALRRGECHALMGENGAGKSTLGKILAGILKPDSGQILLNGRPMSFHSPHAARHAGIAMVHQELSFCADLSLAENLCLGHYPRRGGVFLNRSVMRQRATSLLEPLGVALDVTQPMRRLSTGQEQIAQIAAAVGAAAQVIVFDEPTSSLSETEAQRLFTMIERLRAQGVTILYVSHRMPEVFRLADRISVLRDSRFVETLPRAAATEDRLVTLMIGRPLQAYSPSHLAQSPGTLRLSVRQLSSPGKLDSVSLEVRAGEIVGLAGLVGAGRSELARAIFGLDPAARGNVEVDGVQLKLGHPSAAMRAGIGLVPEDRKREGLVLAMSCRKNFALPNLDRLRRFLFLRQGAERREARQMFTRLQVKSAGVEASAQTLSGGNQQKIVLAKWLARKLKVLIVDEPTRGVDVGAKAAIHALLDELARGGLAILLISSELPEVLNLSTRILVMRSGQLVAEVARADASQQRLMTLMAGLNRPSVERAVSAS